MKYKIVYQGQVKDPSGYGVAARGYIECLLQYFKRSKIDVEFKIVPIVADQLNSLTEKEASIIEKYSFKSEEEMKKFIEPKDYFYIVHHVPVYAQKLDLTHRLARNSLRNICFTVWETDSLPPSWNDILLSLNINRIVVPCEWNKYSFEKSLKKFDNDIPVAVVPHLVDDSYMEDTIDSLPRISRDFYNPDKFNCLTVGQWTDRKALISVVKAFLMEFYNQDDCNLIIKTYGNIQVRDPEFQKHQQNQIAQEIKKYKRGICSNDLTSSPQCQLTLLYGLLSKTDMNFLYEKSNIFALFSRAEGFGLPIAEAILHSTPVIVHDRGGHVDFVDPQENFIVDTFESPSFCTVFPNVYSCESNWYDTNLLSARKELRKAYEVWKKSPEDLQARGIKARKYMLKRTGNPVDLGKKLFNFIVG